MNILIVDDEQLARERLIRLIEETSESHQLQEASNGAEALKQYDQSQADLILLDIRMPVMDGLETAQHLSQLDKPPAIVFTTAYQDHALEAFEAQAIDYLLKPIRLERLQQAIAKASVIQQAHIAAVQAEEKQQTTRTHVSAKSKGGLKILPVDDILYFKAEQKYVSAISEEGELILDESLKTLEAEFEEQFIRIHRNTLVASQCIRSLEKDADGNCKILLKDYAEALPVSRRHISQVKKYIKSLS